MSHPPVKRRHPPPPPHPPSPPRHYPPPPRLLPASTFTYIASWRGQLLICTVVLLLGSIWYFVVQGPLAVWSRKRQEKRSAALSKELLEAEDSKEREKDRLAVPSDTTKKASVQNRKSSNASEGKKRKGSILKVPAGEAGLSSGNVSAAEKERKPSTSKTAKNPAASPSPAAEKKALPTVVMPAPTDSARRRPSQARENTPTVPPPLAASAQPIIRLREPTEEINPLRSPPLHTLHTPPDASSSTLPAAPPVDALTPPHLIPLPFSPVAGPSRLPAAESEGSIGGSAEGSVVDDGEEDEPQNGTASTGKGYKKSEGFSIMPDATYLPTPAHSSSKKKKKKARASSTTLPALAISPFSPDAEFKAPPRKSSSNASTSDEAETAPHSRTATGDSNGKRTSHNRQASLGRPPDMSLEDLLDHREKTIDSLRAEIGIAKAEEGKAREEASQLKMAHEKMKEQLIRLRKIPGRENEVMAQRRETDLASRLQHVSVLYDSVTTRLMHLETYLRDTGIPIPSALSSIHMHPQTPHSPYQLVSFPSPHPRGTPVTSPMFPTQGYHPGNSPQMIYPQHGYRSASVGHAPVHHQMDNTSLAGPLTPGLTAEQMAALSPIVNPHPAESGRGRPGNENVTEPEPYEAMDSPRRKSIALEVFKKKADHPGAMSVVSTAESGEGDEKTTSSSPSLSSARELDSATSGSVHGLGVGEIEKSESASFTGPVADEEVLAEGQDSLEEPTDVFRNGRPAGGSVSTAGSSHPTSPSPRRTVLCTPANAEVYRIMSDPSSGPIPLHLSRPSSRTAMASAGDIKGIKVVSDGQGGTVYFREDEDGSQVDDVLSEQGSQTREREHTAKLSNGKPYDSHLSPHSALPSHSPAMAQNDNEDDPDAADEDYEYEYQPPMFASLAHTDAQRAEMDRVRRESRSRSSKSRSASANVPAPVATPEETREEAPQTYSHERLKTT